MVENWWVEMKNAPEGAFLLTKWRSGRATNLLKHVIFSYCQILNAQV